MQQDFFTIISGFVGQSNILTVPRIFISTLDGIEEALFVSQLLYWTGKSKDGWVWKTYSDWEEEIGIKERTLRNIKTKLEKIGLIETKIKKARGSTAVFYKLNTDKLLEMLLENVSEINSDRQKCQSRSEKFADPDRKNLPDPYTIDYIQETTNNKQENFQQNFQDDSNEEINSPSKSSSSSQSEILSPENANVFAENISEKEVKKMIVRLFNKKYKSLTGSNYPDFGKLGKLSEKAAKFFLSQSFENKEHLIYRIAATISFAFERKKTDPAIALGRVADVYAELKAYASDKNPFFQKVVEKVKAIAQEDVEEILGGER
ncbi:MAG: hypothetical protein N2053_05195 [Chitinispirillaceae bacterium]|nr:hypothetical protein [Chitinispirillaceae bacterium]